MSSKIWKDLITLSIMSNIIGKLISLIKYEIPRIFKYDFDQENLGLITSLILTSLRFFIYFSTMFNSDNTTTLLVITIRFLLSTQI